MSWGDPDQLYDLKSTSKSIGATVLALAIQDGHVKLDDHATSLHPDFGVPPESNRETGWLDDITLRHLANQTAGFEKPGGYEPLLFEPGTQWHYSDGGPNWLAECLTLIYERDLNDVLFDRVFEPIGIQPKDLRWRNHAYRPDQFEGVKRREFGSGFHADVEAMARIGYLYLRKGRWNARQILPEDYVAMINRPSDALQGLPEYGGDHGNASDHYRLLWWNNTDGTIEGLPRDAFWSWGLYDSLIVVVPSLDLVVSRAGKSWERNSDEHYEVLKPFLEPIAAAVGFRSGENAGLDAAPPYPPSAAITGIQWAPTDSIVRRAKGSDNWPLTWSDDGAMYGAYGDGWGFEPRTPEKLSLGLVKVTGGPKDFKGQNIRSSSIEQQGDGSSGKKASGILSVDGVLYLWARNADNSQLAWSEDHGRTWEWSDWRWTESFGAPTFLNFGKDYAGARDWFVYVYSHDSDSAYEPSDKMILARVPKDRIREQSAYQFFREMDSKGEPQWTRDVEQRGAVFRHEGNCYRSGITWNEGLNRYLWCQILPDSEHPQGPRFQGGIGIYDAPEPWGPWTTVFYTEDWDVGPGETASLPVKWMSEDGTTVHLVFSGDDFFSVRKAVLETAKELP